MTSKIKFCVGTLALVATVLSDAQAQGPVRRGLRATGEAAANVVGGTARGAANVAQGTAQATGNVLRGTANATGNVLRGTANATRNVVTAPFGGPAYTGQYQAGYRGVQAGETAGYAQSGQQAGYQGQQSSGPVYQLRTDSSGREFICDHGHRVYVNGSQANQAMQNSGQQQIGQSGHEYGQNSQANWQQNGQQQAGVDQNVQGATYDGQTPPAAPQANNGQVQGTVHGQAGAADQGAMTGLSESSSFRSPDEAPRAQRNEPNTATTLNQ